MSDLRLWDTTVRALRPLASIHSVGKLGFNGDAAKFMGLDSFPSFVVATQSDDVRAEKMFLIETSSSLGPDIPPVRVVKAGAYFYLNIRNVLDQLEIDYRSRMSVYSIKVSDDDYEGCRVYVLSRETNKLRTRISRGHEDQDG